MASPEVTGLLLCRVGSHGVALRASEVNVVEPWRLDDPEGAPHVSLAFGERPTSGRALVSPDGERVAIDGLEVSQDALSILPAPSLLARFAGGSVEGFIEVADRVWPLLSLHGLAAYLRSFAGEGGP